MTNEHSAHTVKGPNGKTANIWPHSDGKGFDVYFCYNDGEHVYERRAYKSHKTAMRKVNAYFEGA